METTEKTVSQSRRHNPLTFYLRTLLYMFMALLMRAVTFLPLYALFAFPVGSPLRWLAVLTPILLIFFILPQRFSFAQAITQNPRERRFSFDKATSVQSYGTKLGQSLLHALHILLWTIPLILMLVAAYLFYKKTDVITLMNSVTALGVNVVTVLYSVGNFFIGIFGGAQLVANGGLMDGITVIASLLALGVLVMMWGALRNSARRYIWALATHMGKDPRTEVRRRLHGHRWAQLGVGLINLVLWVPTLFVVFTALKSVLSEFSGILFNYLATQKLNLPELSNAIGPLLFAFFVCYLPLLPVRRVLTAFFATRLLRHPAAQMEAQEPSWNAETAAAAQKPDDAADTVATIPVTAAQAHVPYAAPLREEEADEPTPTKPPVPAYEPYHVAQAEAEPSEPQPEITARPHEPAEPETVAVEANEPAAEPTFAYHPYQPEGNRLAPETVAAAEPEEPLAAEQEDFFAQPYQPTQTVADDPADAEDAPEKTAAPYAADGEADQ